MKNKKLKWLIPVCAVAVAVIVALVLVFAPGGGDGEKTAAQQAEFKVYWNVDGKDYRTQKLIRSENGEGHVYITFSADGEQIRMPVAGRTLAQKIDALEVMGLEIDENGVITDCYRVEDMDGKILANRYYVTAVDGNKITCNSAPSLMGYDVVFEMTEETGVWDVGMEGITCGIPGSVKVDDQVIVVLDREGNTETVYVISYQAPPDIYWNVERKYDSVTKTSTREMDAAGGYSILLAVGGEQVTVKTRDYSIVQAMDAMAAKCFALEFDENGMVSKVTHAGSACGGGSCASWYSVDEYADNYIRTTKLSTGAAYNGYVSKNVMAYDVSGHGDFVGQPTTIRMGDTVHCLRDSAGRIVIAFVVDRIVESEMYWNVDRKWDASTGLTTRTPAKDGWYYIKVAVGGKQITVKTQDKEHVQTIDARAAKCFGLKLDGDVIQKVYQPASVTGGGTFASWYDITELNGKKLTCYKISTGDTRKGTITADCEIYNVSTSANMVGEVTQVQVGDRIHALKDRDGNICVIYVVNRFYNYPTYYNLNRQWNSTTQTTTRTPDADGYYVFEMACNGKIVTVKTKSKSVANDIDSQAARCVALSVSNGIVYKAVHPSNTTACKGGPTSSYTYVTKVTKYGFNTKKTENGVVTKTYQETFAPNCRIYNVSTNVISHKGEETTVQAGDMVHCLKNGNDQVVLVYVLSRFEDLGVYYNLDRMWDGTAQITTRTPDADGNYVFQMAHDGQEVTVKTASLEVANAIDSQIAKVLGIEFDSNGLAIKAVHAQYTTQCKGGIGVSYADVTAIDGNKVTTNKSGTVTTFTMADDANIFDVSGDYMVNRGERTTLRVGDFIHCLKGADGKTNYIYCMTRGVEIVETEHTCQHVTEDVQWYEWNGKGAFAGSGHYVLNQDAELSESVTVAQDQEITLCLNGHTLTSDTRIFKIHGKLNICDHKDADGNYRGKLSSSYSNTLDADGNVTAKAYAAIAYLYNNNGCSELNIYGGNFEHTGSLTGGGLVYVANTTDNESNTAVFNLYDGVLTGGKATYGGAVYVSNLGGFGMYGGIITDCSASKGGAVYMDTPKGAILMDGGTIRNCTSKQTGAAIQTNSGTMVMTGGIITGNTATGSGGGISMDGGELLMQGGSLDGNTGNEGGNLRIARYATVVLTDDAKVQNGSASNGGNITMFGKLTVAGNAQIVGGKATGLGSAISIFSNYDDAEVKLNMLGGNIEGQIRLDSNKAVSVDVYLLSGSMDTLKVFNNANATVVPRVHVGGTVTIKEINLSAGKTINVEDPLEDTASIGVSMADPSQPFTTITDPGDAACFHAVEDTLYRVENVDNELYLVSILETHTHCLCNGTAVGMGSHTCADDTQWQEWTDPNALPTTSGNYYLCVDVTLSAMFEMKGKLDLRICLNSHTITGPGGGKRAFLLRDADLHITDCQGTGKITNEATSSLNGGLIYQYSGSSCNDYKNSVNLYGGTLTTTGTAKSAGVLYLGNNTNKPYYATFNLYGGTITGGKTTGSGGNITVTNGSMLNVYGGIISGGEAGGTGGNISQNGGGGIICLLGGTITGGKSATSGNDVYVSEAVMLGGQVKIGEMFLEDAHAVEISGELPLTGEASVGIKKSTAGMFATNVADETVAEFFKQVGTAWNVEYDATEKTLSFAE